MTVASLGIVASGSHVGGAATISVPFTQNIPRSDPTTGATLIQICYVAVVPPGHTIQGYSFSDDAATDAFYGFCMFSNGLNPYNGTSHGFPLIFGKFGDSYSNLGGSVGGHAQYQLGCVLNPITTSNNLILEIEFPGPTAIRFFAVAYTGVQLQRDPSLPVDTPLSSWAQDAFGGASYLGPFGEYHDIPDDLSQSGATWSYNSGTENAAPDTTGTVGPPFIIDPQMTPTVVYPDYEILGPADLITYVVVDANHGSIWTPGNPGPYGNYDGGSSGVWTWGSGAISTVEEFDDWDGNSDGMLASMVYAEQVASGLPITGQDITGSWAGIASTYTVGGSMSLASGPGPECPPPPPPTTPVFDLMFRARD